jgi:hypothetical protein
MARASRKDSVPGPARARQEAASARLATSARRTREEQRDLAKMRRAEAERVAPEEGLGIGFSGLLFRFVTCGTIAVGIGLLGHLTVVPERLGVGSALLGTIFLLSGFVIGGALWYLRDATLRMRHPRLISDERIIFSFIVFTVMPFAVLFVVLAIWIVALVVGSS